MFHNLLFIHYQTIPKIMRNESISRWVQLAFISQLRWFDDMIGGWCIVVVVTVGLPGTAHITVTCGEVHRSCNPFCCSLFRRAVHARLRSWPGRWLVMLSSALLLSALRLALISSAISMVCYLPVLNQAARAWVSASLCSSDWAV